MAVTDQAAYTARDAPPASSLYQVAGLRESELEALLAQVKHTDIVELEVAFADCQVVIRREGVGQPPATAGFSQSAPAAREEERQRAITSPLVGIFRPTIKLGERVTRGQPLGAIEAMGLVTTVEAPEAGVVEEVLALEGSPVEYGQPLVVLRRAAGGERA